MKYLGKHNIFDDLMIGGVLLTPPDPATYSYELTLPNDDGTAGQLLTTDGNGVLTWTTVTPGTGTVTSITPAADVGSGTAITGAGTLTFTGGSNLTTSVSGTTVTFYASGSGVAMTNGVDNRVMTATGAAAITGESTLTYDATDELLTIGEMLLRGESGTYNGAPVASYIELPSTESFGSGVGSVIKVADTSSSSGASLWIEGGDADGTNKDGGNMTFKLGTRTGTGATGIFDFIGGGGSQIAKIYDTGLRFPIADQAIVFEGGSYDTTLKAQTSAGADRTITLPDATGTVALTSDIPAAIGKATSTTLGTVKLEDNAVQTTAASAITTTASRTYGVQLNASDQAVVNVPWTDTDTKVTLNGTTTNGVATYGGVDTLDIESTLTYASNTLTIGLPTNTSVNITTPVSLAGQAGDRLTIACAHSGSGTNIAAGQQIFASGIGTGSQPGGMYSFIGAPAANIAGGSGTSRPEVLFQIYAAAGAASSSFTKLYDINDLRNYFTTEVKANGQTILTTVDNASHTADLAIVADGAVSIASTDASNDITLDSAGEIELNADGGNIDFKNNTAHFAKLENLSNGRGRLELYGGSCGAGSCGSEINLYEDTGAGSNHITLKGNWTSGGLGSDKTIELPNADGTVALTDDSDGGQYWHQIVPGYRQNNTSTTFYYTFYRNWYENWSNGDSSPTSISYTDSFSNFMIAPRAGKITNIKIQGTAADTGATDPFKFYLMKGAMSNGSSSVTLTHMFNTSAITPPAVNQTWSHTEDFTSSNTFAEDDMLFIWLKKDSNSGNQDLFFNININGVYTN